MSTAQVQRLEGLLARVQQNRQARPAAATAASPASVEMDEPVFDAPKPKLEPTLPEPRVVAAPKPMAPAPVAQPVVSMKPAPVAAPVAKAAPAPMAKPVTPEVAVARSIPVASAAVDPNVPSRVVTSPAPPSAPIAQPTSPHPTMDGPSFGELLRRSLALRPR